MLISVANLLLFLVNYVWLNFFSSVFIIYSLIFIIDYLVFINDN
jgi:hypothetical protein